MLPDSAKQAMLSPTSSECADAKQSFGEQALPQVTLAVQQPIPKEPSSSELLQHAASSACLEQTNPAALSMPGITPATENMSIGLRGAKIEVRANPPRLKGRTEKRSRSAPSTVDTVDVDTLPGEPAKKRSRTEAVVVEKVPDEHIVDFPLFAVPRLPAVASVPQQTLRISAGRAAAAAGLHPFTDISDLFVEFLYQDLPDLLLRDAAIVGVEIISPEAEKASLLAKSGTMEILNEAVRTANTANWLTLVREQQKLVTDTVGGAETAGELTQEEAADLKRMLEMEISCDFGARHEDAAIDAYAGQVAAEVYGQQRRVSMAFPRCNPEEALLHTLPPLRDSPLPREEQQRGSTSHGDSGCVVATGDESTKDHTPDAAHFRLTGFVDGLVDLTLQVKPGEQRSASAPRTVVVEVKHRMAKIKEPPNLYDVIQLCCYCRVFGLSRGHLVQCLREESPSFCQPPGCTVGQLHVTDLDFSFGSSDRKGWDEHVLPALYKITDAVYAARSDETTRLRLLAAENPEARRAIVTDLCPHLK